jgi:uncharacterized membrane protein YhaH (DUF805 family)
MNATHEDLLIWLRTLLFSPKGRLGPLSYISYYNASLFFFLLISLFFIKISSFILFPLMIVMVYTTYVLAIKRLHDLNMSGWFILLGFVPVISLFFGIYLLCFPGKRVKNKYGLHDGNKGNEYFHSGQDYTRNRVLILLGSILGMVVVFLIYGKMMGRF